MSHIIYDEEKHEREEKVTTLTFTLRWTNYLVVNTYAYIFSFHMADNSTHMTISTYEETADKKKILKDGGKCRVNAPD